MTDWGPKPKTVGELIEELKQFPAELRVVVNGYEGGFHDCRSPKLRVITFDAQKGSSIFGPHVDSDSYKARESGNPENPVVHLSDGP